MKGMNYEPMMFPFFCTVRTAQGAEYAGTLVWQEGDEALLEKAQKLVAADLRLGEGATVQRSPRILIRNVVEIMEHDDKARIEIEKREDAKEAAERIRKEGEKMARRFEFQAREAAQTANRTNRTLAIIAIATGIAGIATALLPLVMR